jgi:16S rRNA (guanine527-N7)-methyltransferase
VTDVSRETRALLDRYSGTPGMLKFAEILASDGVERGLIGPREVDRLWPRHLANCAVVAEEARKEIPPGSHVGDVGSGAGLPGVVWALVRPDISVTLIEPLLRRATFLNEAVEQLDLGDRVTVVRARAEDLDAEYDVVTARAVARLGQLVTWTLPLTRVGGWLVALKGAGARDEIVEAADAVARLGGSTARVEEYGGAVLAAPTTAVLIQRLGRGAARR